MLSLEQMVYLVKCYGLGVDDGITYRYAIQRFNLKYPGTYVSVNCLRRTIDRFNRSGSVMFTKKKRQEHEDEDEEASTLLLKHSLETNPRLSLRKRALETNISKSEIQRTFKRLQVSPYKPIFVHKLEEGDPARRLEFCLLIGEQVMQRRYFYKNIFFSDESTFTTNGVVSTQNCRYWAKENPHFTLVTNSQRYKKVNVWCGIMYDKIVGPYFFGTNLNQTSYLDLLENFLLPVLDEVNLQQRCKLYFQQDGCPAHNAIRVRQWLNTTFPQQWIGSFGPIKWPARSPDLTPLDFFLWGYLKQKVYSNDLEDDLDILKEKIQEAVNSVTAEMIRATYEEFRWRIEKCVEVGGEHVEHTP